MFVCHAQVTRHYRYDKPKCLPHLSYGDMILLCHCPDYVLLSVFDESGNCRLGVGSVCHLQFSLFRRSGQEEGLNLGVEGQPEQQGGPSQKTNNKQEQKGTVKGTLKCSCVLNEFPHNYLRLFSHTEPHGPENQALLSLCIINRKNIPFAVGFSP